jgi:hypothetical protein
MNNRHSAFSLLGAAVALGVVVLTVTLVAPGILRASGEDATTRCLANARGMGDAHFTYSAAHGDRLPGNDRDVGPAENSDQASASDC